MQFFDINTAVGHWPFQRLSCESIGDLEEKLRRYEIIGAAVVNTHGLFYRNVQSANEELRTWIAGKPFFSGVASINPAYPRWENDMRRCVEDFGFRAVRLTPLYHGYEADGDEMDAALDAAEKLSIPAIIPQRIMDPRQRHDLDVGKIVEPETVFALAERHPGCRIVCTETIIVDGDLERIGPLGNLYIEISRLISGFSGSFLRIVDALGAERLVFGSGTPFKEVLPAVLKLTNSGLPRESMEKIAVENALKLTKGVEK